MAGPRCPRRGLPLGCDEHPFPTRRRETATLQRPQGPRVPEIPRLSAAQPLVAAIPVEESEDAIARLTLAFSADPAARWLYPDAGQYLTYWPRFLRAFGGPAFQLGTAFRSGGQGVGVWLPPGTHAEDEPLVALLEESVAPDLLGVAFAVFEEMAGYHPAVPHWYLPLLGVDPTHQGRGHGSAILRHALALCDADGTPAYLESTNPANNPLYERHGFRVVGRIERDGVPPIWPMVRPARRG
jgi:ribosomal protein S18 acetylase RimI-like enzyme